MAKRLFGRSCSVTWTPGTGGETVDMTEVIVFTSEAGTKLYDTTPLGNDYDRWDAAGWGGSVQLVVNVDDSTPANVTIPTGVEGTLVVAKNKANTAIGKISGSFLFENRRHETRGGGRGGGPQRYVYTGRFTGTITETK